MCVNPDPNEPHVCFQNCPICWRFSEPFLDRLAVGNFFKLCTIEFLIEVGNAGCNLCLYLAEALLDPRSNKEFSLNADVKVLVEDADRQSPPEITGITFEIQDSWDGFFTALSQPGLSRNMNIESYRVTLGVFTRDQDPGRHVQQRPADPCVSSDAVFETARMWITDCMQSHDDCMCESIESAGLPTRVLDVSTNSSQGRVKLHVNPGEKAAYATLSYCWGRSEQFPLKRSTLKLFLQEGIETTKLPQTLQDAIQVTRRLGIPYLWIDSLCIIQDSSEDKLSEIAKMPSIYKNSRVTISAAVATDCEEGFLGDRDEIMKRVAMTAKLPIFPESSLEDGEVALQEHYRGLWLCADTSLAYKVKDFDKEPLNTRAWTLQESWLSPRLLIFGEGPPMWQCLNRARVFGNENIRQLDWNSDLYFARRNQLFHSDPKNDEDVRSAYEQWDTLVLLYCRRHLTFKEDKTLALSGLAAEFHRVLQDDYLAGLWKSTLPYSLLWRTTVSLPETTSTPTSQVLDEKGGKWHRFKTVIHKRVRSRSKQLASQEGLVRYSGPYICPSWSHLARDEVLISEIPLSTGKHTLMTIHNASVTPESPWAPFGKLIDGFLEVTAPMARMNWDDLTARFVICVDGSPHIYWDYIVPDGGSTNPHIIQAARSGPASFNPQYHTEQKLTSLLDMEAGVPEPTKRPKPPLGTAADISNEDKDGSTIWLLEVTWTDVPSGLVLTRVGQGTFERIGFFKMGRNNVNKDFTYNGVRDFGPRDWNWDDCLTMQTIKLI